MKPAEVVIGEVNGQHRMEVLPFLAKADGQPGKPSIEHYPTAGGTDNSFLDC